MNTTRHPWRAPRPASLAPFLLALTLLACGLGVHGLAQARGDGARAPAPYAIGLWGDLPYSAVQAAGLPRLVADMNAQRLSFSVHDGDLKQGSNSPCNDQLYLDALALFNRLQAPAMFTPGDNDWTDCDRPSNGGYNNRERLDRERHIFFSNAYSMGVKRLRQEVQTEALCLGEHGTVPCVENRRWQLGGVTYVTLNLPGSCNNLCDDQPDPAEFAARNAANIKWLQESFALARQRRSVAVMLVSQANPGWDEDDKARALPRNPRTLVQTDRQPDGYRDFLVALREAVTAFRRPVAYVHGDSHYFRIDRPLLNAQGHRLENFTRVETFGSNAQNGLNDVQWLKVLVDPRSREVFSYQPMSVPGNRTAVPAPGAR